MNLKRLWRTLSVVGVGVAAAATAAAQPLTAHLSVAKSAYAASESLRFNLTLRNDTAADIYVPYWKTVARGIHDDLFLVTRDGQPVPYTGRHYKRGLPTASDMLRIPAGRGVAAAFDLSVAYDMGVTGSYLVSYRVPNGIERGRSLSAFADVQAVAEQHSDTVSVFIEGISPDVAAAAEDALRALQPTDDELEASAPSPAAVTPGFRNCSTSQKSALTTALQNAQNYSQEALNFVTNNTASTARHVRWFGTFTTSRRSTVLSHYTKLRNTTRDKAYIFDCGCTESAYAYVFPNQPYQVFLCQAFWPAPQTGQDSKGGTLVHETSHFTVVAGTDDHAYGATACKALARSSPSQAIDNADSHEYFCELK
jgi:peptidyl-Lys metalloendopeptidase